ncbi:hypothetical protein [Rhodovibrio sodomensis]|nr:hypothetical protein [Rhodovibrio sodomensis]
MQNHPLTHATPGFTSPILPIIRLTGTRSPRRLRALLALPDRWHSS